MVKGEFILKASFVLVLLLINIGSVLSADQVPGNRVECACGQFVICPPEWECTSTIVDCDDYEHVGCWEVDCEMGDLPSTTSCYCAAKGNYPTMFPDFDYEEECSSTTNTIQTCGDEIYLNEEYCCGDYICGLYDFEYNLNYCNEHLSLHRTCPGTCSYDDNEEPFCLNTCGDYYLSDNEVCESTWWILLDRSFRHFMNVDWYTDLTLENQETICEDNGGSWDSFLNICIFEWGTVEDSINECNGYTYSSGGQTYNYEGYGTWISEENACMVEHTYSDGGYFDPCFMCQDNSYCGDGVCDDGLEGRNNNYENFERCPLDCQSPCGNNITEPQYGEECDAGGDNIPVTEWASTKQCMQNCMWVPRWCGDGTKQLIYSEECDFGEYNSENNFCNVGCKKNICGDSGRNLFEGCGPGIIDESTGINYFLECLKFVDEGSCGLHRTDLGCDWVYNPWPNGYCRTLVDTTYCYDLNKEQCLQDDNCIYHMVEECDRNGTIPFSDCTLNETTGTCTYCCDGTCTVQTKYSPTTCTDTDATGTYPSGENYYLQGQLTAFYEGQDISEYDTCYKNELTEQFCSGEIPNSTKVNCTQLNGLCQNGKCTCDCPRTGFDSTYKYCNYQRTGYTGTKPTIMSNDYPLNINDPIANTCCDSASKCVQNVSGSFICRAETYKLTYGGATEYTHICDDGMWVDFDSTQANCNLFGNGTVWAPGGISYLLTTNTTAGTAGTEKAIIPRVGEYNLVGEMECCGDDDDEELVSTYCPNSEINNVPTCCPADNTYKLINGQCVTECPSIERTAKVVIDAPSDTLLAKRISDLLKSENTNLGCYPSEASCSNFVVNLAPIHIPSPTPYAYCADGQAVFRSGTSDDITVTDTTTSRSSPITNCEKTQFCVEEDLYLENLTSIPGDLENFLVFTKGTTTKGLVKYDTNKFTVDQKTIATYKTGTNCVATNCEIKSIPVVQTATCYPTCEVNSSNCFITCINGLSYGMFVFDGPGCTLTGDSCVVENLVIEDYTVTKGLTAPKAIDDPFVDNGRTPTEIYKMYSTSFSTEDFCIPSNEDCIEEAICVSPKTTNLKGESVDQKMKIYDIYGNEYVQAVVSSHASVTGGEYWCPDGYELHYESNLKEYYCKKIEHVCAWGTTGHLTPNCDWSNMLNGEDVWGLYNDECFYDIDTSTPDQYELSCCYTTSYGDIQVYEETYVKVY